LLQLWKIAFARLPPLSWVIFYAIIAIFMAIFKENINLSVGSNLDIY
jgi:hypothetical protein